MITSTTTLMVTKMPNAKRSVTFRMAVLLKWVYQKLFNSPAINIVLQNTKLSSRCVLLNEWMVWCHVRNIPVLGDVHNRYPWNLPYPSLQISITCCYNVAFVLKAREIASDNGNRIPATITRVIRLLLPVWLVAQDSHLHMFPCGGTLFAQTLDPWWF